MAGSTPRPPPGFQCPYERRCPHLDTMSAQWVLGEYRRRPAREDGLWMHVDARGEDVREANRRIKELEKENATLKAKLQAVHRRQFKANRARPAVAPQRQAGAKKRGAPVGHPPWRRAVPQADHLVEVPAPAVCSHCGGTHLEMIEEVTEHLAEDIVLPPQPVTTNGILKTHFALNCLSRAAGRCMSR
ncbi:hypothetical protein GX586_07035 [bacterium]|nr:hypothetical protein [bacterium]